MHIHWLVLFLASIYKWYSTVFVFQCPSYFTKHNIPKAYPCCCKCRNFQDPLLINCPPLPSPPLPNPLPCFTFAITFATFQYTVGFSYSFCLSPIFHELKNSKVSWAGILEPFLWPVLNWCHWHSCTLWKICIIYSPFPFCVMDVVSYIVILISSLFIVVILAFILFCLLIYLLAYLSLIFTIDFPLQVEFFLFYIFHFPFREDPTAFILG